MGSWSWDETQPFWEGPPTRKLHGFSRGFTMAFTHVDTNFGVCLILGRWEKNMRHTPQDWPKCAALAELSLEIRRGHTSTKTLVWGNM